MLKRALTIVSSEECSKEQRATTKKWSTGHFENRFDSLLFYSQNLGVESLREIHSAPPPNS